MRIGDIYNRDGLKGVVVYVDDSGVHGLIMSLDEAFLNWHESDKWCKNLGDGWFMPSVKDFEQMKDVSICENAVTIKSSLKENNIAELEKLADEILG